MSSTPYIAPPLLTPGIATVTKAVTGAVLPQATVEALYPVEAKGVIPTADDGAALAKAAARFAPFAEETPSADDVRKILNEQPMMEGADGKTVAPRMPEYEDVDMFVKGELRYPRAESLHRLLCNGRSCRDTIAVENGPGATPHLSMMLASMGSRVFIKEPQQSLGRTLVRISKKRLPVEWLKRRECLFDYNAVAHPTPAHIVYWVNPTPTMFKVLEKTWTRTPESLARLASYLGRDVILGGYLLIQTDINGAEIYHDLPFDTSTWFPVFDQPLEGDGEMEGPVLPTAFYNLTNQLRIFRRIAG